MTLAYKTERIKTRNMIYTAGSASPLLLLDLLTASPVTKIVFLIQVSSL